MYRVPGKVEGAVPLPGQVFRSILELIFIAVQVHQHRKSTHTYTHTHTPRPPQPVFLAVVILEKQTGCPELILRFPCKGKKKKAKLLPWSVEEMASLHST